jgi:ankyrin repeat protein
VSSERNSTGSGKPELWEAAASGDGDRVSTLLQQRDYLSDRLIRSLDAAIDVAIRRGHPAVAHILLGEREKSSAEPNAHLLNIAALHGELAVAQRAFDLADDIRDVHRNGRTPLHAAAQGGNPEVVSDLLARGLNVNAQHHQSRNTPLHVAAYAGRLRAVELLLEAACDPNARNAEEFTPLTLADMQGHAEVASLLVSRGADDLAATSHLRTSLHRAAETGTVADVRRVLALGADVNARDYWDNTPLHLAVRRDRIATVSTLIDAGADLNAQNQTGDTPLVYAATDQGGSHPKTIRLLLGRHADLNLADCEGYAALHALVAANDADLIRLALQHDPDLEQRNERGETPFLVAASSHAAQSVRALAEAGADVHARDARGFNAAELAVREANRFTSADDLLVTVRVISIVMTDDYRPGRGHI